jgi:Holliday junction resolvase RusA-like endonuclease
VRVGRERGTDRALRYHAYKQKAEDDAIALLLEQGVRLTSQQAVGTDWYLLCCFYRKQPLGDWDNLGKSISDVLEGVLWANDRQVKIGLSIVEYVTQAQDERTEVQVGLL